MHHKNEGAGSNLFAPLVYFAKLREEKAIRRNVKLVREFLTESKAQRNNNVNELALLKQQRKNRLFDKVTFDRLREVLLLSHEMKRLELLNSVNSRSAKKANQSRSAL